MTKKNLLYYLLYPANILKLFCRPSTMLRALLLYQAFLLNEQSFSLIY